MAVGVLPQTPGYVNPAPPVPFTPPVNVAAPPQAYTPPAPPQQMTGGGSNPALDASMGMWANTPPVPSGNGGPVAHVPVTAGNTGNLAGPRFYDQNFSGYMSYDPSHPFGPPPPQPQYNTGAPPMMQPPAPGGAPPMAPPTGMGGPQPTGPVHPRRVAPDQVQYNTPGGQPPAPASAAPAQASGQQQGGPQLISLRDQGDPSQGFVVGGQNFWTPLARMLGLMPPDSGAPGGDQQAPPEASPNQSGERQQAVVQPRGTQQPANSAGGTNDVLGRTVEAGTQQPVLRPDEAFVTGTPYQERLIQGLSQLGNEQMSAVQNKYQSQRENLRASLASRGLLDSGVGAQAEADLMAQADSELRQTALGIYNQSSTVMAGAQQQAVDNAFKLSGLDMQINQLNLNTQQVGEGLRLNDQQFQVWARNLAQQTGIDLAKLYEARQEFQTQSSLAQYQAQQGANATSQGQYLDYLGKVQTAQIGANTANNQVASQNYLGQLQYNADIGKTQTGYAGQVNSAYAQAPINNRPYVHNPSI